MSSLDTVKTVKTPSELLSAVSDGGVRHIVIQAHMDMSEIANLGNPQVQLQASTKSIQVRTMLCGTASKFHTDVREVLSPYKS